MTDASKLTLYQQNTPTVQSLKDKYPGFYNDECYQVLADFEQQNLQPNKMLDLQIDRLADLIINRLLVKQEENVERTGSGSKHEKSCS